MDRAGDPDHLLHGITQGGVIGSYQPSHAAADERSDPDPFLLEPFQNAEMGKSPSPAGAETQANTIFGLRDQISIFLTWDRSMINLGCVAACTASGSIPGATSRRVSPSGVTSMTASSVTI